MKVYECYGLKNIGIEENENKLVYTKDRYIGLEKELESMELLFYPSELNYWRIDNDGSLRQNGKELKFSKPLRNNGIILALKELNKLFKNNLTTPTHSIRTSDHFHVNIRDFDEEELKSLHKNVLALEQSLFNFGKLKFDRKHNPYCVPHWIFFQEYTRLIPEVMEDYFILPKYLSVGFNTEFGTVEFRMFESSTATSEILRRINVLLEFVENSKYLRYSGENLTTFAKKLLPKSFKYISKYIQVSPQIETLPTKRIQKEYTDRLSVSIRKSKVAIKPILLSPTPPPPPSIPINW
jgi:hypothetical protein